MTKEEQNPIPDLSKLISSGDIAIGNDVYIIAYTNNHRSLLLGDRTVVRDIPEFGFVFVRISDSTIHPIHSDGQYLLVKKETE